MSVKANFEKEFYAEEYEMLVLVKADCGGAVLIDDMLKPSIDFLASIDLRTGTLSEKKGRIEWLVKKEEKREGFGYDFKQLGIYHIVVRKCIPIQLQSYQMEVMNNRYMLVKVLQEDAANEALEALKEHYAKPVSIKNELGEFVLDREFSWFEGSVDWNGAEATVYLETDEEDGDSAEKAMEVLLKLAENFVGNDIRYRQFAAKELTALANDWLQDSDEEDLTEITEEMFAERIEISEVNISPEGDLTLYYYDDDMFWGHIIEILVEADGEMKSADIAG